ncbi:MAG: hypothetical protein M3Q81_04285 [bacterium]|nr:hypothetical protein [bacterium]
MSNHYTNYKLETNRHVGQNSQAIWRKVLMFSEDAIKFLVNFIGEMIRMVRGR